MLNARMSARAKGDVFQRWGVQLIILLSVGVGIFIFRFRPKPTLSVRAVQVQRGVVYELVTSSTAGDILPNTSATARAQIAAPIIAIYKQVGDRVGEAIAELDASDLLAQLKQSNAAIRSAQAQVSQARAHMQSLGFKKKTIDTLFQGKAATDRERIDSEMPCVRPLRRSTSILPKSDRALLPKL